MLRVTLPDGNVSNVEGIIARTTLHIGNAWRIVEGSIARKKRQSALPCVQAWQMHHLTAFGFPCDV